MNQPAKTFKDLIVWQKAHLLVLEIYKLTQNLPNHEQYDLISQIRRASVSIPANIAEGFTRRTTKDKSRFMNIAQGSLEEVRYYLLLIQDLKYSDTAVVTNKLEEVSKILSSYRKSVTKKI